MSERNASGTTLLVVNADDFGLSSGINRGIVEAHERGIVTSASLMVDAPRTAEAVEMSSTSPDLSLGLHFAATDEQGPVVDLDDMELIAARLEAQFASFVCLVGKEPTHLDSHHHVHKRKTLRDTFISFSVAHGLPLRKLSPVRYLGFYAQWEYGVTVPEHVSVEFLTDMLSELEPGAYEIGCHPGYLSEDFDSIYHQERELELATLTDPRTMRVIEQRGIELLNYRDLLERI